MSELLRRVREMFPLFQADGVLVTHKANIRYICGYTNDIGVLLVTRDSAYLLTDFRFVFQAQKEVDSRYVQVVDVSDGGYPLTVMNLCRHNTPVAKLAIEAYEMPYLDYVGITKELTANGIETVPIPNYISELRFIKTPEEIEKLRMAEHIGDLAFSEILPYLKPGVTEREIAARLTFIMQMHGASGNSFDPIVASGVNSSMPHAIPSEKKLEEGDFVTMDFGCIYQGYCSDMTRTVVLGKASPKQKEIYETVALAQEEALKALKPGRKGREIDAVARKIIDDAGYRGCFGHGLGHSVGLEIHEDPFCNAREERVLKAGMIMTVEPGIYVKDFGGVRIEDMVLITEDGYENLAHSEKKLIEL